MWRKSQNINPLSSSQLWIRHCWSNHQKFWVTHLIFAVLPSGYVKIAIENGPVEIVSFPMKNGGSFHRFLYVYQRVPQLQQIEGWRTAVLDGHIRPPWAWKVCGVPCSTAFRCLLGAQLWGGPGWETRLSRLLDSVQRSFRITSLYIVDN